MKTTTLYGQGPALGLRMLLAVVALGFAAGPASAQEPVRVLAGDITIASTIAARFTLVVAPDGGAIASLATEDSPGYEHRSQWFVGQSTGNRLRAVGRDGTDLTSTVHGGRVVGTVGNVGWSGTVSTAGPAGVYRAHDDGVEHLVIVAPDGSWAGGSWPAGRPTRIQLWDSSVASLDRQGDDLRARPNSQASYITLSPV
jgi:hypothetical protein